MQKEALSKNILTMKPNTLKNNNDVIQLYQTMILQLRDINLITSPTFLKCFIKYAMIIYFLHWYKIKAQKLLSWYWNKLFV